MTLVGINTKNEDCPVMLQKTKSPRKDRIKSISGPSRLAPSIPFPRSDLQTERLSDRAIECVRETDTDRREREGARERDRHRQTDRA